MRYYKMITYAEGQEYETREELINEDRFRQIQKALAEGADMIILENRVLRRASIKEILPADDIVAEYQREGLSLPGLTAPADKPKEIGTKAGRMESAAEILNKKREEFSKRMNWK